MDRPPLIACEHCASLYLRCRLAPGEAAACERCEAVLWRGSALGAAEWLALALTGLLLFVIANSEPIVSLGVRGAVRETTLLGAIATTWRQGHESVALMTGLAGFVLPLLQLLILVWVLAGLARGRLPQGMALACRLLGHFKPWSMVPVFLLGVIVSVVKLAGLADVQAEAGLYAFGLLAVAITMLGRLSPQALWRLAEDAGLADVPAPGEGQALAGCHACGLVQAVAADKDGHESLSGDDAHEARCVRCQARLHRRKPEHLARTWALLLSAAILYIPANALPVMHVASFLGDSGHTILGGVVELWKGGSWDIALIVFVASVVVPLTKLLSLALLALRTQWGDVINLRPLTRLYRMVEFIGQWSMLDVFVVILLAALADFPGIMTISAGAGAASFGMVVVLTMLAAMSFDPRRVWDRADADASVPQMRKEPA